jgi:HEAT repeat protein
MPATKPSLSAIRRVQRGGTHRRTDADERALLDLFIQAGDLDRSRLNQLAKTEPMDTIADVLSQVGYSTSLHEKLGRLGPAFFELEKDLARIRDAQLKALASPNRGRRLAAARWLLSQACKEIVNKREACLMSPLVTERLIACIQVEQDAKVKETMALALAYVLTRYFPDARAYPLMTVLSKDKSARIRLAAVLAASAAGFDQWETLVPLLCDPDKVVRASACSTLSKLRKRDLRMIGALDGITKLLEDRVLEVRFRAFYALLVIDAAGHADLLRAACEREKKRSVKKLMLADLDYHLNNVKQSRRHR